MRTRERLPAVLALLLLVIVLKIGQEVYRWFAYGDERAAIENLQGDLTEAGVSVVRTSIAADSLRAAIDDADEELRAAHSELEQYEARIARGDVTRLVERVYRADLESYNARVSERNELMRRWQEVVQENHRGVDRFNLVADSIRTLATRMGELEFPIPSPAEIVGRQRDSTVTRGAPP